MDHDLYRAALALACVFAVVLGASLFPATGFGTNPVPAATGGNGTGDTPGGGTGGQTTPTSTATTTTDAIETTADDTTDDATETNTGATDDDGDQTGGGSTDDGAGDATETATTTAAPAAGDAGGNDDSVDLPDALFTLLTVLVVLSLGLVLPAVGLGRHHRRRYPARWDLPSAPHLRVLEYVRRIPQTSLAFVMFAGTNAPGILDGFAETLSTTTSGFAGATNGLGTLGRGLLKAPAGIVTAIGALGRGIGSFTLGLGALMSLGSGTILGRSGARPSDDPRTGASDGTDDPPDPDPRDPPASVREAWERLQEDLDVHGRDGETPGEIARTAVDRGLPRNPVRALTRAFREVRYGGRPDDGERVTAASTAYERIRAAIDGKSDSQ